MERMAVARPDETLVRIGEIDEATGLPRQKAFLRSVDAFIEEAPRKELERLWVGAITLPVLRYVRSSVGWVVAARYLKEVARFLRQRIPDTLILARLDGPDLAVAAVQPEGHPSREEYTAPTFLGEMFHVDDQPLFLSLRAGLVWWEEGDSGEFLLRKAHLALQRAERGSGGDLVVYDASMEQEAREGTVTATELPQAMERGELELYYQPKVHLADGTFAGVEALLRWPRPAGEVIPVSRLIEIAEATDLIIPLGRWVLRQACRQAARWQAEGLPPFRIAVNVSAVQFIKDQLYNEIREALEAADIPPQWLEIELTESALATHGETTIVLLQRLADLDIPVAIDDFGMGYSSLAYMKRFPIQRLKIDRSFVQGSPIDPADAGIVRCAIAIGRNLGFTVVAEGVETAQQARMLREERCDEAQGFYFSRPLRAEDVPAFIRSLEKRENPPPRGPAGRS